MKKIFLVSFLVFVTCPIFGQDDEVITRDVSQEEFDTFCDTMANDIDEGRTRVG